MAKRKRKKGRYKDLSKITVSKEIEEWRYLYSIWKKLDDEQKGIVTINYFSLRSGFGDNAALKWALHGVGAYSMPTCNDEEYDFIVNGDEAWERIRKNSGN